MYKPCKSIVENKNAFEVIPIFALMTATVVSNVCLALLQT